MTYMPSIINYIDRTKNIYNLAFDYILYIIYKVYKLVCLWVIVWFAWCMIDNIDVSVRVYDKMEKKKINWKATKGRQSCFPLSFSFFRFKNPVTYITYYYCYNNSGDRLGFEGWQRKSDKNDRWRERMGWGAVKDRERVSGAGVVWRGRGWKKKSNFGGEGEAWQSGWRW